MSKQDCQNGKSGSKVLIDQKPLITQATMLCDQVSDLHAQTSFLLAAVDAISEDMESGYFLTKPARNGLSMWIKAVVQHGEELKTSIKNFHAYICIDK